MAIGVALAGASCTPFVGVRVDVPPPPPRPVHPCATAEALQARAQSLPQPRSRPFLRLLPNVAPPQFGTDGTYTLDLNEAASTRTGREGVWRHRLRGLGFRRGYVATWRRGLEFVKVEVFEFGSPDSALGLQAWTNGLNCPFANEAFQVPEVAGSIGFQVRWEGGFANDQVSFVRGPRRYVVIVGNGSNSPPPRAMIADAVRKLAEAVD